MTSQNPHSNACNATPLNPADLRTANRQIAQHYYLLFTDLGPCWNTSLGAVHKLALAPRMTNIQAEAVKTTAVKPIDHNCARW